MPQVTAAIEGSVTKLSGSCKTAGTGLPDPVGSSIGAACTNVTQALAAMPKELCANATASVKKATGSVCKSIAVTKAADRSIFMALHSDSHDSHAEVLLALQ